MAEVPVRSTAVAIRVLLGGVAAGLVVGLLPGVAEARPRNPSDDQIKAAQQTRASKASAVGRLTGLVAMADGDMRRATDQAELAVERYNKAVVDLGIATQRAHAARAAALAAHRSVAAARRNFSGYARNSYIQGNTLVSAATLLEASSPTDLVGQAALLSYAGSRRLKALSDLDRATVRQANADSLARRALAEQQQATRRAEQAKIEAAQQVAAAQIRLAAAQAQRAKLQQELESARIALNGLVAERQRYRAWVRAQAIAAAQERERQRRAREEAARRLEAARQLAERSRAGSGGGGSGGGGGGGGSSFAPSGGGGGGGGGSSFGPSGGGWTATKGQWVADAAMRWLGTRYAWGGGNNAGPTYGVNGPGAGFADGSVFGFDCSGLAMWAWAQVGIYLPHYSGYQYLSGQHVSVDALLPGDLVFWAYDTSDPGTIHHVAIYIGDGQVIQAPESGDVVRISQMWFDGYIGATRPGT